MEPSIFVDVGSNPVNTVSFVVVLFFLEFFSSQIVFNVSCIGIEFFPSFFRLVACCIC